ncbi:2-succinyl-5-enolpyruvyl-6-hydroxy-3-cyclohexene-1-carboxylic-acid synthase [Klebsiella pneumoniae]
MSVSAFNRRWAAVILEALTRHGVQHICIAPGSRSTPLTLAAAENRAFIHHTHFDERGLGHLALGLAKASRQPVAVIVTSGTATANLYPALIEAGLTGEKLILLTADRPPELIDCGANQAIRQPGMFASHPAQTISLPRPSQDIPARWLVSTIDQALGALHAGGVHINCPFAEPLYGDMDETGVEWQQQLGNWWQSDKPWLRQALQLESEKQRDWFFWRQKRGVVVAGRMSAAEGKKVAEWAQTLGWPLIGDVLSQTGQPLPCADLWLGNGKAVYSNRGASGIDGLIATAAGVQRASARPTLAIVGDLSALYDLNSLALLRQASAPLVLIVVNNNGGQIFSMLPTPQDERRQFYLMPQDVDFSHAAAMFGLAYHRPDDWPSLDEALAGAWRRAGATVIELAVNETDGAQTLQQLLAQVSRL